MPKSYIDCYMNMMRARIKKVIDFNLTLDINHEKDITTCKISKLSLIDNNIFHLMYHIYNETYSSKNSCTALVYLELMAKYLLTHKYQILA